MKKLLWAIPFVAMAALSMWQVDAAGVTVSFANPPAGNVFPAGPDFATDVIGDPWDMNSMNDISIDPQQRQDWASLGVNAGTGVPNAIGGLLNGPSGLSILYQGHYGVINAQRNGRTFPIDTNFYRRLSFKIKTDVGNTAIIWWFHRPYSHPSGEGIGGGIVSGLTTGAYQVRSVDLSSIPNQSGEVWTAAGTTVGLRIDPNPNPENVFFDWIRLTAADSDVANAKMQTVQWTGGTGNANVDVMDSTGTTFRVCSNVAGSSCSWNYGIVPPGNYTVTVTRGASNGTQTFRVNNPPTVQVTTPSMTSGQDYATTSQPSSWDMHEAEDIDNDWIGSDHLVVKSFPGTEFIGRSDGVCVNDCVIQPNGDPEVYILGNNENGGINRGTIDSTKYRYLTFDMQIDHAYDLYYGSVGRILFGHNGQFVNGVSPHYNLAVSEPFLAFPGYLTYSVDLGALGVGTDLGIEPSSYDQTTWASSSIRQLRIDPHEFAQQVDFHLRNVKLTAMSQVSPGNTFQINFNAADADADATTVRLFRDTDRNGANGWTEITSSPLSGVSSFNWNTTGTPTGNYYIFALVSDGVDTRGWYSNAPVKVAVPSNGPPQPFMSVDAPADGANLPQNVTVSGWAIDKGTAVGTGIDQVHIWAQPAGGGSAIGLGVVSSFSARSDIAAVHGAQFTNCGFTLSANLPAGSYTITAYGHSTVTNSFNVQVSKSINVVSNPAMSLDRPLANGTSGSTVTVSGWAVDLNSASGTGVDQVHVYAFPSGGGSPIALGVATYGLSRTDVGSAFGNSRFNNSGYQLVKSVPPGNYTITAYAHSIMANSFNRTASAPNVTVNATNSNPQMNIDSPPAGASRTRPFTISGWAVDGGASSGPGIDAIHVWAVPVGGGSQFLVGAATYGLARPDVGSYMGSSQFNNSGYSITINSSNVPSPGAYDFYVFAHSTVTGNFPIARIVRVNVS